MKESKTDSVSLTEIRNRWAKREVEMVHQYLDMLEIPRERDGHEIGLLVRVACAIKEAKR